MTTALSKPSSIRPRAQRVPSARAVIANPAAQDVASDVKTDVVGLLKTLSLGNDAAATRAARELNTLTEQQLESVVAHVDLLVPLVVSPNARVAEAAAYALATVAKTAPARVAKHLPQFVIQFDSASEVGRIGLVEIYATLCAASIAYQRKLDEALQRCVTVADAKTLLRWSELLLPILKGEPHANVKNIVELRANEPAFPRAIAQKLAVSAGFKLRPRLM